jgi:hypothetical protein
MGFGLVIGCIELLQLVTTSAYNAFANSWTRLLTRVHTKSFQFVFTGDCLLMDLNSVLFCSCHYRLSAVSHLTCGCRCSHILDRNSSKSQNQSQSYGMTDSQSANLSWCQAGAQDQIFVTVSCGFVDVGRPHWWEVWSVVYNCCWLSPSQSFLGPSLAGLMTIFYYLRFNTPPIWRARFPYLYLTGIGWPSYTPRHWVPFLGLLWLIEMWRGIWTHLHMWKLFTCQSQSYFMTGGLPPISSSWHQAPRDSW